MYKRPKHRNTETSELKTKSKLSDVQCEIQKASNKSQAKERPRKKLKTNTQLMANQKKPKKNKQKKPQGTHEDWQRRHMDVKQMNQQSVREGAGGETQWTGQCWRDWCETGVCVGGESLWEGAQGTQEGDRTQEHRWAGGRKWQQNTRGYKPKIKQEITDEKKTKPCLLFTQFPRAQIHIFKLVILSNQKTKKAQRKAANSSI